MRVCTGCHAEKSPGEFGRHGTRLRAKCKPCHVAENAKYGKALIEKKAATFADRHPKRAQLQRCATCHAPFRPRRNGGNLQVYCNPRCKEKHSNDRRVGRRTQEVRAWFSKNPGYGARVSAERKLAALRHIGGASCVCCGEDSLPFLTVDHKHRDGGLHRKQLKLVGTTLYQWILEQRDVTGLRVLCMNCNFATRYGRPCPHEGIVPAPGICGGA
jgi:hypothetical protein